MAYDFHIGAARLLPVLTVTLLDEDRAPVSLAAASGVTFTMRLKSDATVIINAATATPDPDQTNYPGKVVYTWSGSNTATAGVYQGRFAVTWSAKVQDFPNPEWVEILIS